jgi:hypothetical protein
MAEFAYARALQALSRHASVDVDRLLAAACAPAWDPVVYLADFARETLLPLSAGVAAEPVAGTAAGRVFTTGEPAAEPRRGHQRAWVPVTEQTARIGVLAVSLPDGEAGLPDAELLGVFAGLVVAAMNRVSDAPRVRPSPGGTTTCHSSPASSAPSTWPPAGCGGPAPGTRRRCCCATGARPPSWTPARRSRSASAPGCPRCTPLTSGRATPCWSTPTG